MDSHCGLRELSSNGLRSCPPRWAGQGPQQACEPCASLTAGAPADGLGGRAPHLLAKGTPWRGGRPLSLAGDVVPARGRCPQPSLSFAPPLQQLQLSAPWTRCPGDQEPPSPELVTSSGWGSPAFGDGCSQRGGCGRGGGRPVSAAQAPAHRAPSHSQGKVWWGPARGPEGTVSGTQDLRHPRVSTFQTSAHRRPHMQLGPGLPSGAPWVLLRTSLAKIRSPTPSLVSPGWEAF